MGGVSREVETQIRKLTQDAIQSGKAPAVGGVDA
jgi:hypothetical protein